MLVLGGRCQDHCPAYLTEKPLSPKKVINDLKDHLHLRAPQVIKAKLEAAGFPVLLDYESIGPVMGLTVDGLGEVRILVSRKDAEEARVLIEES